MIPAPTPLGTSDVAEQHVPSANAVPAHVVLAFVAVAFAILVPRLRVAKKAPPGAVVIGASLSPDGINGAALTFLPSANYLMDDVFIRDGDRWQINGGGSGGGISWTALGEGQRGVLRYGGPSSGGHVRRVGRVRGGGVQGACSIRSLLVRGMGRRFPRESSSHSL
jgi:hypothetical protein